MVVVFRKRLNKQVFFLTIEALSLEVATPDEAREILGLKGRDKVNF